MRRTFAITSLALATALTVSAISPTFAEDRGRPTRPAAQLPDQAADRALVVATRVLEGDGGSADPSPSLALRDLRLALPRLVGDERARAIGLLARPTDGAADTFGDGYNSPSTKRCSSNICLHWVKNAADPDLATGAWVDETLAQLNKVWKLEVGTMGYRKPLGDGPKGGNSKLDVYLKDVGANGYYGYCAAEKKVFSYTYSGYCVLDNDFDPAQFGGAPALNSLKVTAAHEFFHAVQYAYDAAEDRWFMESTATWMEERFADGVNDNLQYLDFGQVGQPQVPLDTWVGGGFAQYGDWAWWEYLSQRKGNGVVKSVWSKAGAYKGAPDNYSTQALVAVLKSSGGFKKHFGSYASGNTAPATSYDEGDTWSISAPMSATHTLESSALTTGKLSTSIDHMASRNVRVIPGASLAAPGWALKLTIDGPDGTTSPTAVVMVTKLDGSFTRETISLSKSGYGTTVVGFNGAAVSSVTLTLANASTRFVCWKQTDSSCMGIPRDNAKGYSYTATTFQR